MAFHLSLRKPAVTLYSFSAELSDLLNGARQQFLSGCKAEDGKWLSRTAWQCNKGTSCSNKGNFSLYPRSFVNMTVHRMEGALEERGDDGSLEGLFHSGWFKAPEVNYVQCNFLSPCEKITFSRRHHFVHAEIFLCQTENCMSM